MSENNSDLSDKRDVPDTCPACGEPRSTIVCQYCSCSANNLRSNRGSWSIGSDGELVEREKEAYADVVERQDLSGDRPPSVVKGDIVTPRMVFRCKHGHRHNDRADAEFCSKKAPVRIPLNGR